jgi:NAD(P)-dependent dehydrogenase (short-subunit alcohol dehydrogenase family)
MIRNPAKKQLQGERMQGKTCLVTGGSSGIGKAVALELARRGAEVIIVSRDPRRGQAALHDLISRSGNPGIHLYLADLSSQSEIRRMATQVKASFPRINALVNVAGSMFRKRTLTADGLEMNLALNYLAYFLLTNLLLENLIASAPACVINVTSVSHWWGRINFDDLQNKRLYNIFSAYGDAKLAIILFTRELARRLEGTGVTAYSVHPGLVATHIVERVVNIPLAYQFADFFFLTPAEGAETIVHLASSDDHTAANGEYFVKERIGRASKASRDMQTAARLWQTSEELTNHFFP